MTWTMDNTTKLAIRTYANLPESAAAAIRSALGSGWKAKVYTVSGDTQIATGTAAGSLGGSSGTITGSVNATFSAACTPLTADYYARIEKSDGTRWLRGTVGLAGSGAEVIISKAAANADVYSFVVDLSSLGATDPTVQHVVAINCGGNAFVDSNGVQFLADAHFAGGTAATTVNPIAGTVDDVLYQSERWGEVTYSIPVTANKTYRVTLLLSEIYDQITAPGQRVFDVVLEAGTAQEVTIADIDIYYSAGYLNAYSITQEVYTTNGTLAIEFNAVTQNPKVNAILITSPDGGAYVPPSTGGGGGGEGDYLWIRRFKTDPHDAALGLMPPSIDWWNTGRDYSEDYTLRRVDDTRIVPWNTIFAAGARIWPDTVGVEIGYAVLRGRVIGTGVWEEVYDWDTIPRFKHNRDDYGVDAGVEENYGTAAESECVRTTNASTKVVRRANSAAFPSAGTHIHGFFEVPGTDYSRIPIDRSDYDKLQLRCEMRVVGWPSSNGLAPITNPTYDGISIVALVAADTYSADGEFEATYGGDLGICRAVYLTTSWQSLYWYSHLAADVTADDEAP